MRPKANFDQISKFHLQNFDKQIAPCVSIGRELSFEWSHHRISSTDSKVRVTLQNSIKHSGNERVHFILFNALLHKPFDPRQTYGEMINFVILTFECLGKKNLLWDLHTCTKKYLVG